MQSLPYRVSGPFGAYPEKVYRKFNWMDGRLIKEFVFQGDVDGGAGILISSRNWGSITANGFVKVERIMSKMLECTR